jgi:hypothetical protein
MVNSGAAWVQQFQDDGDSYSRELGGIVAELQR